MKRNTCRIRNNWQSIVSEQGLTFHTHDDGSPYWSEGTYYSFSSKEIDIIEQATNDLHSMCLKAAQHAIDNNRFGDMGIPDFAIPIIKKTWEEEPPAIYGRLDLAYDGTNPPKLLEYNADTPTSLIEASVIQWFWLQDSYPKSDQFNSIHERLIAKWKELRSHIRGDILYFAHLDDEATEDIMTASYLRDTAEQAGFKTGGILMKDIGWDAEGNRFADLESNTIISLFKLYPWEWLIHEEFGRHLIDSFDSMQWMEPAWKMLLSNKAILPILWELYPDHPNLLPAYMDGPHGLTEFVKKPKLSREGANITVQNGGTILKTDGDYGEEGYVYQAMAPIPEFNGFYPVIGSWMIDQEAGGMGIRESRNLVTDNKSSYIPHLFD
jgi:glutathionylspermidine synthase